MPQVYYADSEISLNEDETVLGGLLRHGHAIPNGCQAGACQSCLMIADDDVPARSQVGLTDAQKEMGYFLSCCCTPTEDISVKLDPEASQKISATTIDKTALNHKVYRLQLDAELDYKAGQFITLSKDENLSRSYSLASVPGLDHFIELHIKHIDDGEFSSWIADELASGHELHIQGPKGLCFYTAKDKDQPLFLSGLGTGLAPLYGIVRDALNQGHTGPINMIIGSRTNDGLYLIDELMTLADTHDNLRVTLVTQESSQDNSKEKPQESSLIQQADIYALSKELIPDMKGYRVFLCGADSFVKKMKRQCFMAGANMPDISADPFLPTGAT